MARLRDRYAEFKSRGAEILAVGPDSTAAFSRYWLAERLPFIGLPDPGHRVASLYKQQVKLLKLGRLPLVTILDGNGMIRFAHYGASMSDIPDVEILLAVLDQLNERLD